MVRSPPEQTDGAREAAPLVLSGVTVERPTLGAPLLRGIDWTVRRGERWAVLGANGAGKTTLLRVAAGEVHPSAGAVRAFGEPHGAPGLCDPRLRMSLLRGSPRFAGQLTALDVVALRQSGPAALRGAPVGADTAERARELLDRFGVGALADRTYAGCSRGEQQRILLARALMRSPALVLLDEPTTGLDLSGREAFLQALDGLAEAEPDMTTIMVTHHVEELPSSTTHALLLRGGEVVVGGEMEEAMRPDRLSTCFGADIALERRHGRWAAHARVAT